MTLLRTFLAAVGLLASSCAGRALTPGPGAAGQAAPAAARAAGTYGPEPEASPTALEEAAIDAARAQLGAARSSPRLSPSLVLAARALARRAAAADPQPLARPKLRAALSDALAFDPSPAALLAVGSPSQAPRSVAEMLRGASAPTHLGAGAEVRDGRAYVVLLVARRTVGLRPFPREVPVGATEALRGELVGLDHPSVHVTSPAGESRAVALRSSAAGKFDAPVRFDASGRWLVEVVGRGPHGPEVAALLAVACGAAPEAQHAETAGQVDEPDPADLREAEERIEAAINATRRAHGLPPLEPAPALAALARRHSQQMLSRRLLAHVLPGSGDVKERLRRARIPYAIVMENVASGRSAMVAHRAAEESPAHRANILSRAATQVGCGIARGQLPTGDPVAYLTEVFVKPVEDGAEDRLTPEARVREALWQERRRAGAPPLLSDPALDALARDAARDMLRAGEPSGSGLGERALGVGRKLAAVDAFVATKPSDAVRSKNLSDPRLRRVGIGVAVGDSARYGAGLLWIAVVYTD